MRPDRAALALAGLLLAATAPAVAGQTNGKHTTSEPAHPPCDTARDEALLSPRARRQELTLLRARLLLAREEEPERLRRQLEARLEAHERALRSREGDRPLNLP